MGRRGFRPQFAKQPVTMGDVLDLQVLEHRQQLT
jgi:hypothetical protein